MKLDNVDKIDNAVLKNEEKAVFALRALYRKYGYAPYKMSKFEEYDLYVRNKSFLVSEDIITFTDTSGKLMALKPDVTLSIVRNSKVAPGCVQKVYYNENVYRIKRRNHAFGEIMQTGLECIGEIDSYAISEVLSLAVQSLAEISSRFVLDISHLGIVSAVLDRMELSHEGREKLIRCVGEKNLHGMDTVCREEGLPNDALTDLKRLVGVYGAPEEVLPVLSELVGDGEGRRALEQLKELLEVLKNGPWYDHIRIDFSVINDMNYYNGIVFCGFVEGIPSGILSGGQYDRLMQRMGKHSGAIGFAVYLDLLEDLSAAPKEYDADVVLLYDDRTAVVKLDAEVRRLIESGKRVIAVRSLPESIQYRQLMKLTESGVTVLEDNNDHA